MKKTKRIKRAQLMASLFAAGVLMTGSSVFAQSAATSSDPQIPDAPIVSPVESVSEKAETLSSTSKLDSVLSFAEKRISERVLALGKLKSKVASSTLISLPERTDLSTQIDAQILALQNLGAQIKATTDIKVAKTLTQQIYTNYRIYAVFIPKINLLTKIGNFSSYLTKLETDTFVKVQTAIDTAKAKGTDVTFRQSKLDQARALEQTIPAKLADLHAKSVALAPADYPVVSKATIKAVNTGLQSVQTDLKNVSKLLKEKDPNPTTKNPLNLKKKISENKKVNKYATTSVATASSTSR